LRFLILVPVLAVLAGCGPDYSPNTYSTAAVQQANKVERGVVVGVRPVAVTAKGTVGAVTGAATGGVMGSQTPGGFGSAMGAIGGTLVGGLVGTTVEQATADTAAFEYIVQKPGGELVSVTQRDEAAIAIGTRVLVIAGNQARIVADYTTPPEPPKLSAPLPAPLPAQLPPSTAEGSGTPP
jgi:outer membrane lipoprotein SlyB